MKVYDVTFLGLEMQYSEQQEEDGDVFDLETVTLTDINKESVELVEEEIVTVYEFLKQILEETGKI